MIMETISAPRKATKQASAPPTAVFTIGYEGTPLAEFINLLVSAKVTQLLDVRCNAVSRKRGFGKKQLMQTCSEYNIQYVHMPELGIPSELRSDLRTKKAHETLMIHYKRDMLPSVLQFVQQAAQFAIIQPSAFMCFEKDINCCHRKPLVDAVSQVTGLSITHL
jgi:uncharacterized protein (DUF488 family)